MRKHFLILMLLTLLPLAGWADAIQLSDMNFTIKYNTYEYSGAAVDVKAKVYVDNVEEPIAASNYVLKYNKVGESVQFTSAPIAVGDYEVQAVVSEAGVAAGYAGATVKVAFNITKATINSTTITAPTAKAGLVYNGTAKTLIDSDHPGSCTAVGTTIKYSLTYNENGVGYTETLPQATNAGTHKVYYMVAGNDNYNDYIVPAADAVEATIAKQAVTITSITDIADVDYNGAEQKLNNVEVTCGDLTFSGNAVVVEYYPNDGRTGSQVAVKNAGTYYLKIHEAENSNYSFADNTKTYKIKRINADIVVVGYSKTYDGHAFNVTDTDDPYYVAPQFSISGLVAADQGKVNLGTISVSVAPAFAATADTYVLTPDVAAAKIADGEAQIDLATNYNVLPMANNWVIKKRKLTISAPLNVIRALNAPLAATDADVKVITSVGALAGEKDDVEAAYKVTLGGGAVTTAYTPEPIEGAFIPVRKEASDYTGDAGAQAAAVTAANNLLANYCGEEQDDPIIIVNGKLSVTGAPLTIRPVVATTVSYGTKPEISFVAYNTNTHAVLDENSIDATKVAYQFKGGEYTDWTAWTAEEYPKKIDTYTVRVVKDAAIGKGNYTQATTEGITCNEIQFAIVKKTLTVAVPDVVLWNGATKTILNAKYKATGYDNDVISGENVDIELAFTATAVEKLTVATDAETGEQTITFAPGYTATNNVIEAKFVTGDNDNDNYEISMTGTRKLTATDLVGLDLDLTAVPAADIYSKIKDASDICKANDVKYTVELKLDRNQTIGGSARIWNAKQFHMLVLPFEVTLAELAQELGYVVVNTADKEKASGNKVYLSLEWESIPANTPFFVRTATDIVDETLNFANKKIVAPTTATAYPSVDAGNNIKLVGAYNTFTITKANSDGNYLFYTDDGKTHNITSETGKWDIVPFDAYIDVKEAPVSARDIVFVFEDVDGGTTSIKAVEFMNNADSNDGWYNLNGVKMQNAPTQKGIYINNGKKIVVK